MDTTEPHPRQPERSTVEADPAYDYSEDQLVDEDWDEEDEFLDEEERVVPLDAEEEFRAEEEEEA